MEEECVYTPKSHMIIKEDRWTLRYKKWKAMKEDEHSRTNLAHNADCRARIAESLVDDVAFRTKVRKAVETKRRTSHHGPISQSASWRQYVAWVCSCRFDNTPNPQAMMRSWTAQTLRSIVIFNKYANSTAKFCDWNQEVQR